MGASTVLHKAGGRRWRTMVEAGFAGPLYPIHPTATEVLGRRAYRSLRDLPEPVDLVVVLVRSELVPEAVAECAALAIPAVVVITAGFGETGPEGKRLERALVERLRKGGGRLMGPNCAGLFSASGRVNVLGWAVPPGPIAVISQSGNMALTFCQLAREKGLGFSKLVTVGNAADLRIPEYVEYLFADAHTRVIVAYLEGFEPLEGRALFTLLREHPTPKPLIVLKPGQTESGRRAALSHTGALAGEHRLVEAALRQCGAIQVADGDEAWDVAIALASLPPLERGRVVVVSDGGGHATLVCDAAAKVGLEVPPLSEGAQTALRGLLPPRSGIANPVDFAGVAEEDPEVIPRVLDRCLAEDDIGGAIVAGHFGGYFKIGTEELGRRETLAARELASVIRRRGKPVVVHTIYGAERLPALDELRAADVPIYRSPEAAARVLGRLWQYRQHGGRRPPVPRRSPTRALLSGDGDRVLLEPEARELLAAYGIPVPPYRVATTADEAVQAAGALGGRLALKLVADGLLHKTEAGGVVLDVDGPEAVRRAHDALRARAARLGLEHARVLLAPMLAGGLELAVGAFRDVQFGPVVMLGLGGIFVEALEDVAFALAPLDEQDAVAMLDRLRGRRLLDGLRGRPPRDRAAVVDVLLRVSELVMDHARIRELDVNPLFFFERGAAVADARVVLG
jgi:acetate---CoA ligase (ADP-forming)